MCELSNACPFFISSASIYAQMITVVRREFCWNPNPYVPSVLEKITRSTIFVSDREVDFPGECQGGFLILRLLLAVQNTSRPNMFYLSPIKFSLQMNEMELSVTSYFVHMPKKRSLFLDSVPPTTTSYY